MSCYDCKNYPCNYLNVFKEHLKEAGCIYWVDKDVITYTTNSTNNKKSNLIVINRTEVLEDDR